MGGHGGRGKEKNTVNGDNKVGGERCGRRRDALLPEDRLARGERSDALKLSLLCFRLCALSAVSSSFFPFFCPSFSANVGVFHSWLEARGADLPLVVVVVGYSKREGAIKSEKKMKGKEEAGVGGGGGNGFHVCASKSL